MYGLRSEEGEDNVMNLWAIYFENFTTSFLVLRRKHNDNSVLKITFNAMNEYVYIPTCNVIKSSSFQYSF